MSKGIKQKAAYMQNIMRVGTLSFFMIGVKIVKKQIPTKNKQCKFANCFLLEPHVDCIVSILSVL